MNKYKEALNILVGYMTGFRGGKTIIQEYINTLQELVDKATPKKPTFLNYDGYKIKIGNWQCPHCNKTIIIDDRMASFPKHCDDCDQLLDWSDDNE